jgi:PAS domain S-box-containing protein
MSNSIANHPFERVERRGLRSLRALILRNFLLLALSLSAILIAVGAVMGFQEMRRAVVDRLQIVADLKQQQIERWMDDRAADLSVLAVNPTLVSRLEVLNEQGEASVDYREAYSDLWVQLTDVLRYKLAFTELFVLDADSGITLVSTDPLNEGDRHSNMLYFEQGKLDIYFHSTHLSEPRLASRSPTLLIACPVRDSSSGQLVAVLAAWANLADLEDVITEMGGLEEAGETYLVNTQHRIVTTSRGHEMQGRAARSQGIEAALGGQDGWDTYQGYTGAKVIGAYRWLPRLRLALMVEQAEKSAVQAARQSVFRNIVVAVLVLWVAVGLGIVQGRVIVRPLTHLTQVAAEIAGGDLSRQIQIRRHDEIGVLASVFAKMTTQLRGLIDSLEQRVADRTMALAYRSMQLETVTQVSEAAGSVLDPDELERQVVKLIRDRFDYYYVGLFLVDESGEWTGEADRWAVLRAGTGEAGRAMLESGHKLEVGGASMIGACVADGRARIALDVGEESVRFDNPFLPETHSEMALPLMARGQVIGALTVQSVREAAFDDEDVSILQTMAAQVANAIGNAQLFEQAQTMLVEVQESERLLRSVIDATPDWIFVKGREHRYYLANKGYADALHIMPDHFAGKNDLELGFPEELVKGNPEKGIRGFWADDRQVMDSGKPSINPHDRVTIDGSVHILHTIKVPLQDAAGDVSGVLTIARDVTERERLLADLESRALQLRTAAEISHATSSILDTDALLTTSVNLIRDRFEFYYVGLFLVDEAGEFAVLRAGTGGAGQAMLEEGYKLAVGGESAIGWCVTNAQARIALDVGKDAVRFVNPLLPGTRSEMALPLTARGQVIGAMTVQSAQEAAFSGEDIPVLQTMANQVANAISNARLFGEIERRNRELAVLNAVSSSLSQSLSLDELLTRTLAQILEAMSFDAGLVSLADPQTGRLVLSAQQGLPDALRERLELAGLDGTLCELVFSDAVVLGIGDLAKGAPVDVSGLVALGLRSYLGTPLPAKGKVLGTLCLFGRNPYPAAEADFDLMRAIGRQMALGIDNAQLFQEAQASLQEVTRLHQRYLQEKWEEFLAEEKVRQRAGYLFDQREVQPMDDLWRPEIEMAVARGRTLALTAEDEEWRGGDGDAKSALVVPLRVRGQVIGALDLFEADQDRQWSEDDIALVEAVADQVALAVENARAYEEIQKTAVRLREMDTLKSQFLANMSHELRTPLNSIIGFSRVMLKGIDGPLTELQKTDLTSIYTNGQHLLGLINDVLDMSRIEAGMMELVFEPLDLRPIIDGVMSTAMGLVKDRPVELVQEVDDDLPIIRADSTRIRQVLLNLISNAAKFTEEGSITMRAWADDDHITISVIDTGRGIPEEHWGTIFQEFQQVDGTATRRVGGTGLGLPISRHFVELHGGRIWVESEMGIGSTFTFTIPIHGPGYVQDPELAALEIDSNRRLVLAVEGDEGMMAFYRRYLERHGYQIVGLADADRVQAWVRELSPFAVLMDIMMPQADGWKVLEKLKTSRETAHVPVIICSIGADEAQALSLGAAAYLTKPVLEKDLLQAMAVAARLQSI